MTTDTDTLVARLRGLEVCYEYAGQAAERIEALELLLARNLVLDRDSAEEGADALGGIGRAIELVEAYREANPLPEIGGGDDHPF